jgi:Protein of unknown function DUF262/Protein of unknown function (DUF1524)
MTDAKAQITFEELGLGSLLRRWRLVVPPNQREYSWTDKEVTQLLQDFAKAINEVGIYFLGTIVTIPRDEGTLEVVDGQQRLATTAILLAAIRDYLQEKREDLIVQSIDDEFLSGIDREKRIRVPKLRLNIDDNEMFDRIVTRRSGELEPEPVRASHERLLLAREEAKRHVRRIVAPLDEREHGDLLNRWVSFLEHRALVVLLRVPDDANAYKMFETLNDRGLRTSQADLIKNFLFSRAGKRMDEVQSRWSYMRGALESASDDTGITINFLRHALIVQRGHLREADVYDRVQDIVRSEPAAITFAATLETLANIYVATFNPENERWNTYQDSVRRAIEVFNLFDIKPLRPLIVAIAARMDPKQTAASYNFLIALGVRLITAASTRSGSVEIPVAEAAKDVFEGTIGTAAKLRDELAALTPTDGEFRSAFRVLRVSNAKFARYYLRSLEMTAKNESEPWFVPQDDKQVINLEHVLPRKPETNWPEFDEDEVRELTTRLGNLALMRTSENSQLKSQAFADKKIVYAASPYLLTSQIAEVQGWTAETIDERQRTLAELALETWPV